MRVSSTIIKMIACAAAAGALVVPGSTVAAAAPLAPVSYSHTKSPTTPYCAQELIPNVAASAQTIAVTCFVAEVDAIATATGDMSYRRLSQTDARSKLMSTQTRRSPLGRAGGASVNAVPGGSGNVLLSTDYDNYTSTGGSLYWYGAVRCGSGGTTYNVANIGAAWNDRIRSVYTWGASACNHNIYWQHQNYAGAYVECGLVVSGCPQMGSVDGQATSIKWYA